MIPVAVGNRTDADLIKMKFLIVSLFVCAASAASFGNYNPARQSYKPYSQSLVTPVATAPVVAAKDTYDAARFVAAAPVAAAKPTYDTAKVIAAAPVAAAKTVYNTGKEAEAAILRSDSDITAEGFNYNYETANGIASQVSGILKKVDDAEVIVSQGSYQYTAPDGTPVEFSFVADENGYQPRGNLLPVGPPVPEAIIRSLEYIRTHPQKPENY